MWYEKAMRARILPLVVIVSSAMLACPKSKEAGRAKVDPGPVPKAVQGSLQHRPVIDTHVHIAPTEITRAVGIFDEVGISWGLNLSGLWPGGPLEEQLAAAKASGRLLVACNLPWFVAKKTKDFPTIAVHMLEDAKKLGARALKVEKGLGLHHKNPEGKLMAVDDPWLDPIWEAAGRLHLPVVIHTGDPKAFWLPVDENNERLEELTAHPGWSYFDDKEVPSFEQLLEQHINLVKKHPNTTFVSVHFGNNSEDPFWVADKLEKYPNMYVDIAARVPEIGRHDPQKVKDLFIKYRKRILFGTDLGIGQEQFIMLGSFGEEPNKREEVSPFFKAYFAWLEATGDQPSPTPIQGRWTIHNLGLPEDVLDDIYVNNALTLFGPAPEKPISSP
jgi:predicted TIM-barrel fold metal-dependent hydrolase